MFSLRPYQIDALNVIHNDLSESNNPVLLQAIMGSGKTVIVCRLINRYYFDSDKKFLILAHKQELVSQFLKTFQEKTNIPLYDIGISCSGLNQKTINRRITIASVQTFFNQVESFGYTDLVVIDEAHRISIGTNSQYDKVLNTLKSNNEQLRILGITATPYRLGHGYIYGDMCSGENLFPKLNHHIKYEGLKNAGYLMPLHGLVCIDDEMTEDMSKVNIRGDYDLFDIDQIMRKSVHLSSAKKAIEEHCQDYNHICVFCCTIEHAIKIHELLGDECTLVHSELTDIERNQNMNSWIEGRKRIMASVNILIEGFDFPALDCLVMARPTKSTSLYLQAVGRVLRICESKEKAFLLDLTTNTNNFGTDLDNIKVNVPKKVQEKIDIIKRLFKICPECQKEVSSALVFCDCGYQFKSVGVSDSVSEVNLEPVYFSKTEPVWHKISNIKFFIHKKEGKPDSLRVEYHNENIYKSRICSEWVCLFHDGYAQRKAQEWWTDNTDVNLPQDIDEAIRVIDFAMMKPVEILIDESGKYPKILDKKYIGDDIIIEERQPVDYDDDIPF